MQKKIKTSFSDFLIQSLTHAAAHRKNQSKKRLDFFGPLR